MSLRKVSPKSAFDFNIDIQHMLFRPRVDASFNEGLNAPLTIIYAPAGYGKTTAALQFSKSFKGQIIYMSLGELDSNPQYFWEHFSNLYGQLSMLTGTKLAQLGFPSSNGTFSQFVELLKGVLLNTRQLLIIDDFHLADCPEIGQLLVKIAGLRLKSLNILLLSRTVPKFYSMDLKVKGLIYELNKEDLRFNEKELLAYFKTHNIELGRTELNKIDKYTEGWACAVFLSSVYYRQNPETTFDLATFDIERLIENTVFGGYDNETKDFLLKLSILNRFDTEICSYVTGKPNSFELLSRVLFENSLIKRSQDKRFFEMHRLLRDFLQKKLLLRGNIEKKELHLKAAEYWEYKNDILMSLLHLDQAEDYEKMAQLILKHKCAASFSTQELMKVSQYMEKIPKGLYYKYPMLLLISAMSLTRTIHAAKSFALIVEVEKLCEDPAMSREMKDRLFGEAAVIKALMSFNDTKRMLPHFKEAARLLPEGTELLSEKISFTFGCPSIFYLYYNKPGELDNVIKVFTEGFKYWEQISSCGYGADYLLKAEAAFERCEYEKAEQDAYRAIYRAEQKNQTAIIIAAKLLLVKLSAAKGAYSRAAVVLKEMQEMMNYRKALIYLSTIDMCAAIFDLLTGDIESIPKWLAEGELTVSAVNRAGFGIEHLIYAQVLLKKKQFLRVEGLIPGMLEIYDLFSNQYGIIRTRLISAVANYNLYGIDSAVEDLTAAFNITETDRITMPYLELGEYLVPLLQELIKGYDKYQLPLTAKSITRLFKKIKEYQTNIVKFRMGYTAAHPEKITLQEIRLTKREKEILSLIIKGFSGDEISKQLFVTPINIRVITSKIYKKLGVSSRVEAVRIAIDNGLVK